MDHCCYGKVPGYDKVTFGVTFRVSIMVVMVGLMVTVELRLGLR